MKTASIHPGRRKTGCYALVLWPAFCLLLACGNSTGPTGNTPMSLSFKVLRGPSAKPLAVGLTDAHGNALEIATAEMVLRKIEFEQDGKDSDDREEHDDCEKVEEGPFLVSLPIEATTPVVVLDRQLPAGMWEEIEFEVHKVERGDPADDAFLDATGFPENVSIRVTGTWTPSGGSSVAFTFTTDLNAEQEIEFKPPLEVQEGETKNVTFTVDLNHWFRNADGLLIDPGSANEGGANEHLVENNIKTSIDVFEDDDRDGKEDDEDEDDDEDDD